ncbi:hypothetical protein D3C81_998830 [compost metagenome]
MYYRLNRGINDRCCIVGINDLHAIWQIGLLLLHQLLDSFYGLQQVATGGQTQRQACGWGVLVFRGNGEAVSPQFGTSDILHSYL